MPARITAADSAKYREARTIFVQERLGGRDASDAIEAVSQMLDLDQKRIRLMAVNENWDDDVDRAQVSEQFATDALRPEAQLNALLQRADDANTLLEREMALINRNPDERLSLSVVQRLKLLQDSYYKALDAVAKKSVEVQRKNMEIKLRPEAQKSYHELVSRLAVEYEGRGPQYDMLIEGAARVHVYLQEMYNAGRAFTMNEFEALSRLHMSYVERLQHYTEATKSEVFETKLNVAIVVIMEMAEREFKDFAPDRWGNFVERVQIATGEKEV